MGFFDWLRGKKKPPAAPKRPETEMEAIRRREARLLEVRARGAKSLRIPGEVSGEELFGGGGGRPAPTVGKRGHGYRSKTARRPGWVHVDAAFDGDEHAAFLLGIKVECRSSWVQAARWNEETSTLSLSIKGKDYPFPGVDYQGALIFSYSGSKGRWYWEVWRGEYRRSEGEFPLLDQMPLPGR